MLLETMISVSNNVGFSSSFF